MPEAAVDRLEDAVRGQQAQHSVKRLAVGATP
jgi:hypothetical protein